MRHALLVWRWRWSQSCASCRCSQAYENARENARGDALLAMPEGMLVIDVNVVHALAVTYLQGTVAAGKSAEVDDAAAAMGEHNKEDEYRRDIDGGAYELEPVVMESGRRLGKGVMRVINRLAKIAFSRMVFRSMCLCGACKRH